MTPLPLLNGDTLIVDNSTMEKFQTCPRAAQYGICHRLQSSADKVALRFGGIAHRCLEIRYRYCAPMLEQTPEIEKAMVACASTEFHGIQKGPVNPGEEVEWIKPPFIPPLEEFRNYDRMVDLIRRYGQHYPFESFEIVRTPDGRPFVEFPFVLPLGEIEVIGNFLVQPLVRQPDGTIVKSGEPRICLILNLPIIWMGKIDLVYESNGGLYIMDHKTASIATNMAEFEISHQFRGYEWAVETILGTQVTGTVINRIVVRKPTKTGEAFTFERKLIPTQRGLVNEWKTDMMHIVADFVEMVRRDYMPKHTIWCVSKFGTCPFHPVCSLDSPEQRQIMLDSQAYEDVTWSPLAES